MTASTIASQVTPAPPLVPSDPAISPKLTTYLRELSLWASRAFSQRQTAATARAQVLLLAPNGSVWSLTVNNSGTVMTTSVPLSQGGP